MAAALELSVEEFQEKYVRQVGVRKSLIELAGGDCIFFDNSRRTCQVYKARPRQCRTWPFWTSNLRSPETWKTVCDRCPGANCGDVFPLEEIRLLLNVVSV